MLLHDLLRDKIVLITGASSGIGKCIAQDFSKFELKSLILLARNKTKLDECIDSLQRRNLNIFSLTCDISNKEDVKQMGNIVLEKYGYIDILVNNAGYGIFKKVEETSMEEIEQIIYTNYFGMIYCTKVFLTSMIKRNTGQIINIASLAASFGIPGMAAYCGSKFAMLGFSESLNYELRKTGVKISVISPITVKTNFFNNEYFNNKIPTRYVLDPGKVSKAVLNSITSNKFQIFVPSIARASLLLRNCFPNMVESYLEKQFNKNLEF